ncbi:MAG TPA: hypothetical protein VHJ19_08715, partial [Gammaproteobacteria bacterium]|nr:hypothetical protein [Gammaproteobacteria bacterium]
MTIDQTKLQAFVHQAVADLAASMSGVMMTKATNVRSKTMKSSKCTDNLKLTRSLLLISTLTATPVLAHGPAHDRSIVPSSGARNVETAVDDKFFPAHLLAAVCGLHVHHGAHGNDAAFKRRVELVKLAQAQGPLFDDDPPLYDNLGDYSYPITTDNQMAQRYFDQGLRLAYAFNHIEAWRAFRKAQELDPDCAMCYWGEAYALGPNINAPIEPAAMGQAVAAIKNAKARAGQTSAREQALIKALEKRYSTASDVDQAALNEAYAQAMAEVAARFQDDVDIASMYADALMNLSPWNYWEEDGGTLRPPVAKLIETLERALAQAPNHPYAIHLYIHAMEASKAPERAEVYADRLGEQMPGAGHLVHMPFHIYFRTGRFRDAITVNEGAVAADEAYLAQAGMESGDMYAYGYYPHNMHSLLESGRMHVVWIVAVSIYIARLHSGLRQIGLVRGDRSLVGRDRVAKAPGAEVDVKRHVHKMSGARHLLPQPIGVGLCAL